MKTVVVTGAARGIGAAIAQRFVESDWACLLADLDPAVVDTAARLDKLEIGSAAAVVGNVAEAEGREAIRAAADELSGTLDALVNNAGITRDNLLTRMSEDEFLAVIRVNLGGAAALCEVFRSTIADGGAIINLSSKSASGNVGQYNYAISKAGLIGLTRGLALELAPRVRVNAIAPAFIATEMTAAIPEELREKFVARIPFGRPGEPEEVANVVQWLCSPGSSYVTGQVLPVCGGRSFGPS